jgi:poly(A) polymerase
MRPFFLANDQRQGRLTLKACLRLVRAAGEALPGLFLVAMADALAGKGTGSPEKMEEELALLYDKLLRVWQERVHPVQSAQPLLNGHDLIHELGLRPGPLMGKILNRLQDARMEGRVATRSEALALAGRYMRELEKEQERDSRK